MNRAFERDADQGLRRAARAAPRRAEDRESVKATIAPCEYPRAVELIDALPRVATGKAQRFRMREWVADAPG